MNHKRPEKNQEEDNEIPRRLLKTAPDPKCGKPKGKPKPLSDGMGEGQIGI